MSEIPPLRRKKQPKATRAAMLAAADRLFSEHGFSATGLGAIVEAAGLTKGALFHHFEDKATLGLAWINEIIRSDMSRDWFEPLAEVASLETLRVLLRSRAEEMSGGSPASSLASIASEVSLTQTAYAEACEGIYQEWRAAVASVLERGQAGGWVHPSIKARNEAEFLVSSFTGLSVTIRCSPGGVSRRAFAAALDAYLETLRLQ